MSNTLLKDMNQRLRTFKKLVADRRLYGASFFYVSFIPLVIGLITQFVTQILPRRQSPVFFLPYVVGYFLVIVFSAIPAKNVSAAKKFFAFHPIGFLSTLALLFLSSISIYFTFIFNPENRLMGLFVNLAVFIFAQVGFIFSVLNIAVIGQRVSLRNSVKLKDDFFKEGRERWEKELGGFPNLNKILENLDEGKYLAGLFERGSFDLVVLWSSNIIANIVDTATDVIIRRFPDKERLFRISKVNKAGETYVNSERYPVQLSNLGFSFQKGNEDEKEKFNLEILWQTRNDIAHRNEKPTFFETIETLQVMVSFTNDVPKLLLSQMEI